jgi:hypothetical protein
MRAWIDWLSTVRHLYCVSEPRGPVVRLAALRVYAEFASIARICRARFDIGWSCASLKKPKENDSMILMWGQRQF